MISFYNHSRSYLYPHTNTKYSTPIDPLLARILGSKWVTDKPIQKGSGMPSLSFQARPKVSFALSLAIFAIRGVCQLI